MANINLLMRNSPQLKTKIKIVVIYNTDEYENSINNLRNACNTSKCEYSLIPIHMKLGGNTIRPIDLDKQIKIKGFKKDLDKICVISPTEVESNQCITFKSLDTFKKWLKI